MFTCWSSDFKCFRLESPIVGLCLLVLLIPLIHRVERFINKNVNEVQRQEWSRLRLNEHIAETIKIGKPVLITHHPDNMPALKKWTNETFLIEHVHTLLSVKVGNTMWNEDNSRSLATFMNISQIHRAVEERNVTISKFFARLQQGEQLYYLGALHEEFNFLKADMHGWQTWTSPKSSANDNLVYVWMAAANIAVQLHYDLSHNFHTIISGCKQFTILPPEAHNSLYLYPNSHPAFRKSQVYWRDKVDLDQFPAFANLPVAVNVTLYPGEVLYIPPMWFHAVKTVTCEDWPQETSDIVPPWVLSTNVWSASAEILALDRALAMPLPDVLGSNILSQQQQQNQQSTSLSSERKHYIMPARSSYQIEALATFVERTILFAGVLPAFSPEDKSGIILASRDFIKRVILPRFSSLGAAAGCITIENQTCSAKITKKATLKCDGVRTDEQRQEIILHNNLDVYTHGIGDIFSKSYDLTRAEKVTKLGKSRQSRLEMITTIFLEKLVEFSLGTPQTCAFWQSCFV